MLSAPPLPADFENFWAMFLDFEGALIDRAPGPDSVVIPKTLPRLLGRLHAKVGGACALMSGRNISCIDRRLRWRGRDAAGHDGADIRIQGARCLPVSHEDALAAATERLMWSIRKVRQALVEIDTRSVTLHYGAAHIDQIRAHEIVSLAARQHAGALRILPMRDGFQLVPVGAGKDGAVARFMDQEPYRSRIPVFAGSDADEAVFREVNDRGGISICVGKNSATAARYRLGGPAEFRAWVETLLTERIVYLSRSRARP
jgi:trehalose 6-phosphate phosphatase